MADEESEQKRSEYVERFTQSCIIDEETGNIRKITYFHLGGEYDGKTGRLDGPAIQDFNPHTGQKTGEVYAIRGCAHRDEREGPAKIAYSEKTGRVWLETYMFEGQFHRSLGQPSQIKYDEHTGEIIDTDYMFRDEEYDPRDLNNAIKPDEPDAPGF